MTYFRWIEGLFFLITRDEILKATIICSLGQFWCVEDMSLDCWDRQTLIWVFLLSLVINSWRNSGCLFLAKRVPLRRFLHLFWFQHKKLFLIKLSKWSTIGNQTIQKNHSWVLKIRIMVLIEIFWICKWIFTRLKNFLQIWRISNWKF